VPTALDAVAAVTPTTSLLAALGMAGGGYLTGREGMAACGAVVGAFGLVVERFSARSVRLRLRRERLRHREDLRGVSHQLRELRRQLGGLRDDLDGVCSERDDVRVQLQDTLNELARVRGALRDRPSAVVPAATRPAVARAPVRPMPPVPVATLPTPVRPVPAGPAPVTAAPVTAAPAAVASAPTVPVVRLVTERDDDARSDVASAVPGPRDEEGRPYRHQAPVLLPGQIRSPIATGRIPVLAPGPRMPVPSIIDLRTGAVPLPGESGATRGTPSPDVVDALVYAAMTEAEAHRVTASLELHTGDAHHAGDFVRTEPETPPAGVPTLYVVKRGRHVA
jgi:hypothetical protein